MSHGFLPRTDPALLGWSNRFLSMISQSWASLGLSAQDVSDFAQLHDAYAAGLAKCDPNIRSKTFVTEKDAARAELRKSAKRLSNVISGRTDVTDAQRIELGLNVRKSPAATPTPDSAPGLLVVSVRNHTITAQLRQSGDDTGPRGRPSHASGAVLFSYVGDQPPTNAREWTFEKLISKTRFEVTFSGTLSPGTKVWLSAAWFNHRKELGPPCQPVATNLQGGGVQINGSLRMAA